MIGGQRVAVIGGGISGLAAAHYLARAGAHVQLFEASDQFGGLGTFFEHQGRYFERFYHCMLPTDKDLLHLLGDLALEDDVYWQDSSFGYLHGSRIFPLNSALDLLRFKPLGLCSRIRVGLTGLYGSAVSDAGLDDITAADWLRRLSGRAAFETFWLPLLRAKFGDRYDQIPALWFWTRFNREKGSQKEVKGYLRGGYKRIVDSLLASLKRQGVEVRGSTPVKDIQRTASGNISFDARGERFEAERIVITTPLPLLSEICSPVFLDQAVNSLDLNIDMQGVLNVILFLRKPISRHYWIAATDPSVPFQGIVETSNVIAPEDRAGYHLVHLMHYTHRSSSMFNRPLDEFAEECSAKLLSLFPHISADDIAECFKFKAPFVEPIYTLGYRSRKPPEELVRGRVYLLTTAQVYPTVTSWNGCVGQVRRVISTMI